MLARGDTSAILIVVLSCVPWPVASATPAAEADGCLPELSQYRIQTWSTEDGLPLDSVLALARSLEGMLWIGTEDGLARFDGLVFEPVDLADALQGDPAYIESLSVTDDDSLLIGTSNSGLLAVPPDSLQAHRTSLDEGWIQATTATEEAIWAGGRGTGLFRIAGERREQWGAADGLLGSNITALAPRSQGGVWVGYGGGGVQWFADGEAGEPLGPESLRKAWIEGLLEDRNGSLWAATRDGLYRLDEADGRNARRFGREEGLPDAFVDSLLEGPRGQLWAGTATAGVARLCGDRFQVVGRAQELPANRVERMLNDGQGGVWVATGGGGLARMSLGPALPITTEQGLPPQPILPVIRTRDGTIWAGTYGAGLAAIRGARVETLTLGPSSASQSVFSLAETPEGDLWAGTRNGLFRIRDRRVVEQLSEADGLPHATVPSLLHDGSRLWIGVVGGLASLDDEGLSVIPAPGIRSNVMGLLEDDDGRLWVATQGNGLFRLQGGALESVPFQSKLPTLTVLSLFQDSDGGLWIGTSSGLVHWDGHAARVMDTRHGLVEASVYSIREDRRDNLWLSGNRGVYRIPRRRLEQTAAGRDVNLNVRHFDTSDGMPSSETNGGFQPAVSQAPDGRLFYPTVDGIAVFDPAAIRAAEGPPMPRIRFLRANGNEATSDGTVQIRPNPPALELGFSALELSQPRKVEFGYRIRPLDDDWYVTSDPRVTYRQMPPGDFELDLRTRLTGAAWSEPATLPFTVQRHLLEYPLVWTVAGLVLAALLYAAMHWRRRRLAVRNQHIQDTQKLEALGQLAGGIAHDFNNILTSIIMVADSLADQLNKDSPLRGDVDLLQRSAERGTGLTRQLLTFARRDGGSERVDVSAELASMEVFLKRVLPGTIELTTRVEPDVGICPMSPSRLQQVVLNLALNARDAMPDGGTLEVELTPATDPAELKKQRLDPQQSYARLHIADTGTGMDRRTRARLFEPLFTTKGPEKGTGLGMAVTLQIVRDVQGAIEVDSQPGEGTRFTVYLPVQR